MSTVLSVPPIESKIDYDYELGNGWNRWQNLVLQSLKESSENQRELRTDLQQVKIDVALTKETTSRLENNLISTDGRVKILEGAHSFLSGSWKTIGVIGGSIVGLSSIAAIILGITGVI